MSRPDSQRFTAAGATGVTLRGVIEAPKPPGAGAPIVTMHGVTAHRDLVVHGSTALARAAHPVIRYDARAHGESDPGRPGSYNYPTLVDDLEAIIEAPEIRVERPVLVGHSMGAHTAVAAALRNPEHYRALVLIGPASRGEPPSADSLAGWDRLADGLERGGVEGFLAAYDRAIDPMWRTKLLRIAADRIARHHHPKALAAALRELPRSLPFEGGLGALGAITLPTLVVASYDEADPGHPYATAVAYAETIPGARLISEDGPDQSPLAWQGGRLSREIAAFATSLE